MSEFRWSTELHHHVAKNFIHENEMASGHSRRKVLGGFLDILCWYIDSFDHSNGKHQFQYNHGDRKEVDSSQQWVKIVYTMPCIMPKHFGTIQLRGERLGAMFYQMTISRNCSAKNVVREFRVHHIQPKDMARKQLAVK